MAFNDPDTRTILAFLERIGIPVVIEPIVGDTFLPAMTVRGGALVIDPARLTWPGDLLHEAGHIAVTDPALRPTLNAVSDSPAEEMSAIAWSWVRICCSISFSRGPGSRPRSLARRARMHWYVASASAWRPPR